MINHICPIMKELCVNDCAMIRVKKGYSDKDSQEKNLYYCGLSGFPDYDVGIVDVDIKEVNTPQQKLKS